MTEPTQTPTQITTETTVDNSTQQIITPPQNDFSKYIFHLWTSKTPPIKYLTELLKDLLTEGNLECSADGIKLLSIDPGRTVLNVNNL